MKFWRRFRLRCKNNRKISRAIRRGILLSSVVIAVVLPTTASAAYLDGGCVKTWGNGGSFTAVADWNWAENSYYREVWSGYYGPWVQMQNRDFHVWHEWGSAPRWTISIQVAGWNRWTGWGYYWIGTTSGSWGSTPGCFGY